MKARDLVTGAGVLGLGAATLKAKAPDAYDVAIEGAEKVVNILGNVGDSLNAFVGTHGGDILSEIPYVGSIAEVAAPFAVPMVAGLFGGKTIADIMKIEDDTKRNWMMGLSTIAGGVANLTSAGGEVTGAALAALAVIPIGWTLKGLYKTGGGVYGTGTGILKGGIKGGIKGGANGFKKPTINPNIN